MSEKPLRTKQLASFISDFRQQPIAEKVQQRALEVIYDGVGALIAATHPEFSTFRHISAFAEDLGGTAEATLVGAGGIRSNAVNAALANGTLGYACDMEPHHPEGILHPVAVMMPTALAVGERVNASGQDFIDAVILGCEIEYRVSIALGPREQYDLGFHPSAVCGCFGATACAAFLLGLDQDAVVRALGLAACQASGMMAWESDPSENARPFQMGMAARNGVTAALLAQHGFGGPDAVFDTGHTIFKAFSRNPEPERLTQDLGERYDGIMELALKPYASVSFLHPALDALLELIRTENLKPAEITGIVLHFPRSGVHCVDNNPLKSHCAQYVLAVAALRGSIWPADLFSDRRVHDPQIAALSQTIEVIADDGELETLFPDCYASVIEVRTRAGHTFRRRNDIARGYPEAWLSEAERRAKFRTLAASVATDERIDALEQCLLTLPQAQNLAGLAGLLAVRAQS
jgi:2-methylcitrate dehydratase PrpD